MNKKQFIFEFTEKRPELDVLYRGRISSFDVEERDFDKILKVKVRIPDLNSRVFTYVVYISESECSRFFGFVTDMQLIRDDGKVDLRRLRYDGDVLVEFVETVRGIFIGRMEWALDDEEVEDDEESEDEYDEEMEDDDDEE